MRLRGAWVSASFLLAIIISVCSWVTVTTAYAKPLPCTGGGSNASVWGSCPGDQVVKARPAAPAPVHIRRYIACTRDATTQAMCAAAQCPPSPGPDAQILQVNINGRWTNGHAVCSFQVVGKGAQPLPQVTPGDARASIEKVLPSPVIGSAPPKNATPLVHVQVITWIKTQGGQIDLGSATLLGRRVEFRGQVKKVHWNFGDGSSGTSDGPGRAYDFDVNPCRDYLCPGYFGHVYTKRGPVTVTARATWFAQFRVDGGAWENIGTVQGNLGRLTMTIHSARTILVR